MSGRCCNIAAGADSATSRTLADRIVAALADHDDRLGLPGAMTYRELAVVAYGLDGEQPTRSQASAVRRTVAKLVAEGRVIVPLERGWDGERHGRRYAKVHRAPTAADVERGQTIRRPIIEQAEARRQATPYAIDTGSRGAVEVMVEPVLRITADGVELREDRGHGAAPEPPAWARLARGGRS